jgi:ATP-dependent DNA helicase DinG
MAAPDAVGRPGLVPALEALERALSRFSELLDTQAERSEGLQRCRERLADQRRLLSDWYRESDPEQVRWVEVFGGSLQLHSTPLSVGPIFRKQVEGGARAWILTSATLSVKGDFSHFLAQMGLEDAMARTWDSPFDFTRQALLYVPARMPDPNTPHFTQAVVEAAPLEHGPQPGEGLGQGVGRARAIMGTR